MFVDILSGRIECRPTTTKNGQAWEAAIMSVIRTSDMYITHLICDRDGVVLSSRWRKNLKRNYNISVSFLMARSKAFKSEIMIKYMKRKLSMSLQSNEKGDNSWIRHIDNIVDKYNSQPVPGTAIPRSAVNKHNYLDLLTALRKSTDATALFNISTSTNLSPWLSKKLFKYKINDLVLVARAADHTAKGQKTDGFFKRSVEGSFSSTVRRVTGLVLKDSHFFLTPTYRVSGLGRNLYYESELAPCLFTDRPDV